MSEKRGGFRRDPEVRAESESQLFKRDVGGPSPENTEEELTSKPNLKVGDRIRLGREFVARTPFGIITGPEQRNGFLRIKPNPEQENKEIHNE